MAKIAKGRLKRCRKGVQAKIFAGGLEHVGYFESFDEGKRWIRTIHHRYPKTPRRPEETGPAITVGVALKRLASELSFAKASDTKKLSRINRLLAIDSELASLPLGEVRPWHINDFILRQRQRFLARGIRGSGAIAGDLVVISTMFKSAIRQWGYVALENPVLKLLRPRVTCYRSRRISPHEFDRLFEAAAQIESATGRSLRIGLLIELAVLTAMRRHELARLDWRHIDFSRGILALPNAPGDTIRFIPLTELALSTLQLLGPRNSGSVFEATPRAIEHRWRATRDLASIDDLRFPDLRHEAVCRMFEAASEEGLTNHEVALIADLKTEAGVERYAKYRRSTSGFLSRRLGTACAG